MNLNNDKIIPLSKIKYRDNWYQIFCDSKGKRFFLKIENNVYKYLSIKEYYELNNIFNKKFTGKYYNKYWKKNTYLVVTLGLELITLTTFAFKFNRYNYTLEKNDPYIENVVEIKDENKDVYEKISKEELLNYITINNDLDYILKNNPNIDEKYEPYIRKYVEEFKEEDLTIFYYNLSNLSIETLSEEEIKENTNNQSAVAYFDIINHKIIISENLVLEENMDTLFHEFRHATKYASVEVNGKHLYNSFTIVNDNIEIGESILEGMNAKYTSSSYLVQQNYIDMLFMILGEEQMKEFENNGDASDLISSLATIYGTEEDATKLIMLMDDELNSINADIIYSIENKVEIRTRLMTYFFVNEQNKLFESSEYNYSMKYSEYVDACDKFQILLQKKFLNLEGTNDLEYTEEDLEKIDNEERVKSTINELFDEQKIEYAKPFLKKYDLSIEEANDFKSWILVKTEATENKFEIDNINFKIEYNTPISYTDVDGSTKILYMYQLYIRKNYLLNTPEEEILKYISYDNYINALNNISNKQY